MYQSTGYEIINDTINEERVHKKRENLVSNLSF